MSGKFYTQATDRNRESFNKPWLIQFEWNIIYACNFRCSYCFFTGKWDEYEKRNTIMSVSEWMKHWERIHRLYGQCAILLTGGEPFIYPNFAELMHNLVDMHWPINVSTNASGDLDRFFEGIDPIRISASLSFHPEFNDLGKIIKKKQSLEKKGYRFGYINLCLYPPFVNKLDRWVEQATGEGETLKIIPFMGFYNGKEYPAAYTAEEKKKLGMDGVWEGNVKKKNQPCAAGMRSALIFPDGKVARCGQIGERRLLGSIFDQNFRLLSAPEPCDVELCPCLKVIEADKPE
ncbi:MAG TPA: radical SAM protein [bacterium]|nr:radical SAM protein [bacterium]